ncbi:MAG: glycoside hydrolase family 31 protein, partial [Candidatus Latescibacterota bacterium]
DVLADVDLDTGLRDDMDPYYISIPFLYHVAEDGSAAGSFIDNGYRLHYDLSRPDAWTVVGDGGQLTEYIFAGPSVKTILRRYTELTGRMVAPPIWALGHHQCRWHDYREEDVRRLAKTFREKRIPCDVLWLDIDYMDNFRIFTWDRRKFPDPAALIADLGRAGFRMVTIIDPGVKHEPGYHVYDEGVRRRLFCRAPGGAVFVGKVWPGHTVFPDYLKEETRAWWADLIAGHAASGLGGIWIDMNEPAVKEVNERCMRFDCGKAEHEHERWHNQYGFLMAQATAGGLRQLRPDVRPFVLSRSGFAGIQRHAANWMGDNGARWEHLALSIRMSCGMGVSGQPFVGSDIGGFAEDATEELLVRWYQYAVFQPFCRNHNMKDCCEQYPWSFGQRAEDNIRASLELRYRLLPYLYSAFLRSVETGEPVQRPLLYDFQYDPRARECDDQFLCGEHLLVAPVLVPGAGERRVFLPEGEWYAFDTPGSRTGGCEITVPAPLYETGAPMFVRAGAVIPTVAPLQSTTEYAPEEITLNVYLPSGDSGWESMLHEDDGLTEQWRAGEFLRTTFRLIRSGDRIVLRGTVAGKGFPEFRRTAFRLRIIGETVTEMAVPNAGESFSVELTEG